MRSDKEYNEKRRRLVQERKDRGVCTRCGEEPPDEGRARCAVCREELRSKRRRKPGSKRYTRTR